MNVFDDITELVGNTPIVRLRKLAQGLSVNVFLKLEFMNPGGSIKDRAALHMLREAEKAGKLTPGSLIIEATSGNLGIALATICAARGYSLILVIPDTMSSEKIKHIKALGAEVVLTPGVFGMTKSFQEADRLHVKHPGSFVPRQISNPANPAVHRETTALEIWNDMDGEVDMLVAGAGTGGTISGTAEKLKQLNPAIKVACVEPAGSPVLSGGKAGPHKLQGIGPGFIPANTRTEYFDWIVPVSDEAALETTRRLARQEGLFVGISSGAAVYAALELSKECSGGNIVVIAPDAGERYLSTELFCEEER
ncbi:cysteine synthase A [Paenibacillus polymyxa]|uniref:Cysteine synthase n=1 Tax=Paenibacillus polymyxa TaxID=1406 RepID=A0A8I1IWG8_PAEPO|nr:MULTISPECIES: cysteine synthase A [Paenibacillus]KAF6569870.1 cysteine synthase A [Paenibacillus sp. EKM206P]KAF6585409.1 cysteine synthase A [Paenibacillus sp. EKM205P]MBM0635692.1 cysteine synthase A [Paenibacillus polymyxa]